MTIKQFDQFPDQSKELHAQGFLQNFCPHQLSTRTFGHYFENKGINDVGHEQTTASLVSVLRTL